MYRMTVRQAVITAPPIAMPGGRPAPMGMDPFDPGYAPPPPPIAALLRPMFPEPVTGDPATTAPAAPPQVVLPPTVPPTLAIPPGSVPVYPPTDIATPPLPPPVQTPGNIPPPTDVVGPNGSQPPTRPMPTGVEQPSGITAWWKEQSPEKQALYAAGGVAALGALAWLAFGRGKMRPNRAAPRRGTGEVITLADGQRWGHTMPPKEYRTQGASLKADYAWPSGYKYPLVFRRSDGSIDHDKSQRHVRSAASYFSRDKDRYPPRVRREIAKNINQAKKRFDVGGRPATP